MLLFVLNIVAILILVYGGESIRTEDHTFCRCLSNFYNSFCFRFDSPVRLCELY